jgi:hypothetical protein
MAASLAHLQEAMALKDRTDIAAREDPQLTQRSPRAVSQKSPPQALLNLIGGGTLKKQFQRLLQVFSRCFNRLTLAGNVHFRTESDETVPFRLNNGRQSLALLFPLEFSSTPVRIS